MNTISFPKNEWKDVRHRLQLGKCVYTVRVDREYGKYRTGEMVKTEWKDLVKIVSVKKISGGISSLRREYEFFSELTKEMIDELRKYDEMDIVTITPIEAQS